MTPPTKRLQPIFRNVSNFSVTVLPHQEQYLAWIVRGNADTSERYTALASSPNGLDSWTPFQPVPGTLNMDFTDILPGFRAVRRLAGNPPRWFGEFMSSFDGLNWQSHGRCTPERYGENWQLFRLGQEHGLIHRWNQPHDWVDLEGKFHHNTEHDPTFARCLGISHSANPASFPASRLLFAPDNTDSGETQFYGTSNIWQRGQLYLMLVHILRDDLIAEGVDDAYGTGYSTVAYSRNGKEWRRFREPFLSPEPGSWNHAIAWGDCVLPLENETRYYFGGYARGHKAHTDRSIGYAVGRRDRLVYATGHLRTPAFLNTSGSFAVNLDGAMRVRILDEDNHFLRGSGVITANSINRPVNIGLGSFKGQRIKLEFLVEGKLYSFSLS